MRCRLQHLLAAFVGMGLALAATAPTTADPGAQSDSDPPLDILALGDSLVQGYGLPEGETFPDQLEAALKDQGIDADVINAGSSGDTSATGRSRLDWVLQERVDAVIVVLGANDALRGIDPQVTRDNLDAILSTLEGKGLPTLLAGMKAPRNMGQDYVDAFDGIYPQLAERYDLVFYPFFLQGVAQRPALNQGDGIHPNAEGVAAIVDRMLPKVQELIRRARNDQALTSG